MHTSVPRGAWCVRTLATHCLSPSLLSTAQRDPPLPTTIFVLARTVRRTPRHENGAACSHGTHTHADRGQSGTVCGNSKFPLSLAQQAHRKKSNQGKHLHMKMYGRY